MPWPEALAGTPYSQNILDDWNLRKDNTPPGHKVYVAITPINIERNGLAPYRGLEDDMPLPAPWDSYAFNHPDVKAAFLNYAINTIEFFHPDFLSIGVEANILVTNSPEKWDAYLELHQYVYTELKQRYPDLPIMVSLLGVALLDGYRSEDDHTAQMQAFEDIMPYTDYYAISLYPYLSKYLTNSIPETMFDDLFSLSDKPIAIAETGYPAQTFSIMYGSIIFITSPEKQRAFIASLLFEADQREFVFVINFVLRDYDFLWKKIGRTDLAALWRDTGFYDENGVPRPVLATWRAAPAREWKD